ncbi:MAG TPA: ATP-binding protein [Denitromonas sp.]|uniref:ATP-binding protein n=1 Tax=Denitromonas sp. TaxID=2734609 RepID=UPI001E06D506|nr:response regulator [Rhodocyclaceae bacterium]HQU87846.1 ATP-binding protein [Denitromonas sp.]HQV14110.1 ATP-binding protein [Denitromonas sp.]
MRLNLSQRFVAYTMLLGVLPLLALGLMSIQLYRTAFESEARRSVQQAVSDKTALLDQQLAQVESLISNISGVEEIITTLAEEFSPSDTYARLSTQARIGYVLNNYLNLEGLVSIDIVTLSGNHYHVGETLDIGNINTALCDQLIEETTAYSGTIYWAGLRPNINGNSRHRKVVVATRLIKRLNRQSSRQEPIALLVVNYNLDHIHRQFGRLSSGENDYMVLIDRHNNYVHHSDAALIGTPAPPELLTALASAQAVRESGFLVSSATFRSAQWRLGVAIPEEVIDRPAMSIIRASGLVMLIAVLAAAVGAVFFLRRVVSPLREITDRFNSLRATPGVKQHPLRLEGDDEISNLKQGFNELLDALDARSASENELRLRESQLRANLENTPNVAVQWYDENGRVNYWNPASQSLFGPGSDEATGKTRDQLVDTLDESPAFADILKDVRTSQHAYGPYEARFQTRDGRRGWILSTVFAIPMHGERVGYVAMDVDITERKAAEEAQKHLNAELEDRVRKRTLDLEIKNTELSQARDLAETANRAKSAFLANMSHELRTPMNAIVGMSGLVLRHTEDPTLKTRLQKIDGASKHLLNVISDILDISKIEAESLKLEEIDFTVSEVLENTLGLVSHKAADKGLSLHCQLSPGVSSLALNGDPLRLGQILLNFLSNSLKFTETGSITLRAEVLETHRENVLLRWEVQDTGIGIAPESQKRLFTAFEQADGSMTRKYGGTGLGLAISKRLVEAMGGKIGLSSTPGSGSIFWFTTPFKRAQSAVTSAAQSVSAEERLKTGHAGSRVLLAEDEPINQEVSCCLLEEAGLQVTLVDDGEAAVAQARKARYDLILMDMHMPNLNGVDATLAIRDSSMNTDTPILALTANAFGEDRQRCLDAGMNDHLAKPVDPNMLYETLLRWLDHRA